MKGYQCSNDYDTHESICNKFIQAQNIDTCIEDYTARRIKRLRQLPPSPQNLEEIRRTILAMKDTLSSKESEEQWPQPPPVKFFTLDGFSTLLQEVATLYPRAKESLQKLSPDERLVLCGLPSPSQWQLNLSSDNIIPSEQETLSEVEFSERINSLSARFNQLQHSVRKPVVAFTSQSFNFILPTTLFDDSMESEEEIDETNYDYANNEEPQKHAEFVCEKNYQNKEEEHLLCFSSDDHIEDSREDHGLNMHPHMGYYEGFNYEYYN